MYVYTIINCDDIWFRCMFTLSFANLCYEVIDVCEMELAMCVANMYF